MSKIILDHPNCFRRVKFVLARSILFGRVQNIFVRFKLDFSGLCFIISAYPKGFGSDQNELDSSKTVGTHPKWFGLSKIILDPYIEYKAQVFKFWWHNKLLFFGTFQRMTSRTVQKVQSSKLYLFWNYLCLVLLWAQNYFGPSKSFWLSNNHFGWAQFVLTWSKL